MGNNELEEFLFDEEYDMFYNAEQRHLAAKMDDGSWPTTLYDALSAL